MNKNAVKDLETGDFDILEINDYRKIEKELDFDFSIFNFEKYEKKYLICWSMGVFISNLFIDTFKNFDKKIALNGTNKIVDDNYGIPEKIYEVTARFLDEANLDKFVDNMFNKGELHDLKINLNIKRTPKELKEELTSIGELALSGKIKQELDFDKVIISLKDRIIPSKNQINYWEKKNIEIVKLNATHYPFNHFKSWQDIIC